MTEKLFYENEYLKEFDATVLSCLPAPKEGYQVVLDRTAFFPEGGGQYGDIGDLSGVTVFDTQETADGIVHYTKEPLDPGQTVHGKIDWEIRFSRMQQHTAEHILSGLVHSRFGYDNVGFHLNDEICTMDFNGPVTREEMEEIERKANEAVYKNLDIHVLCPTEEERKKLTYRSKIEIEGQVRIIEIPGYDVCACCAPHLHKTGEIGQIKIISVVNYKGGVRATMLSGSRALKDHDQREKDMKEISALLSAKEWELPEAVRRLQEDLEKKKADVIALQRKLICYKAREAGEDKKAVCLFETDMDQTGIRELMNLILDRKAEVCAVFLQKEEGWQYVIGSKSKDVRELGKELNGRFQGRGGGKPDMVQGSLKGRPDEIRNFFEEIVNG